MPADLRIGHGIGRGEIRLDVEERRIVEAVKTDDRQLIAVDADKPRYRDCDRIGPRRRAQGEGAAASRYNGAATARKRSRRALSIQ